MNKIGEWIYALKVCKKYNIIPLPFRFGHRATHINIEWSNKKTTNCVWMSPFNRNFLSVFMHEIGQEVYRKNGFKKKGLKTFDKLSLYKSGVPLLDVIKEEAFATRYSRKSLKDSFEDKIMLKYFHTYTGLVFQFLPKFSLQHQQEDVLKELIKLEKRITN